MGLGMDVDGMSVGIAGGEDGDVLGGDGARDLEVSLGGGGVDADVGVWLGVGANEESGLVGRGDLDVAVGCLD